MSADLSWANEDTLTLPIQEYKGLRSTTNSSLNQADKVPTRYRPVPPDEGVGRWIRTVAGVREDVLDWVPEERTRYARLGAIIVNTGLLAALSMFAALHQVVDAPWPLLLPICAIWAFVVVTIDGWLIASTHGRVGSSKILVFLPRLLLSILLGAAIAEPLLLWVFQPAIHKEVLDERQHERVTYESMLTRCNPSTAVPDNAPECADFLLSVPDSPVAIQEQLDKTTEQRAARKIQLDKLNAEWQQIKEKGHAECAGNSGPGLTGRRGEGPNCDQLRREAQVFAATNQLPERTDELLQLDRDIVRLTGQVRAAKENYGQTVASLIARQVETKQANEGAVGLLDEVAALGRLSERSGFVLMAGWLFRILLIALDCLPVLTKWLGGTTKYDERVAAQAALGARLHNQDLGLHERRDQQRQQANVELFEEADRAVRAKRQASQRDEIDALARKLYQGRGGDAPTAHHADAHGRPTMNGRTYQSRTATPDG